MINYLYFIEDELNTGGTGHIKPLYITVRCKDCIIGKVLEDNNYTVNVFQKHVLDERLVDSTYMIVRAYDGSPR